MVSVALMSPLIHLGHDPTRTSLRHNESDEAEMVASEAHNCWNTSVLFPIQACDSNPIDFNSDLASIPRLVRLAGSNLDLPFAP